MYCSFKILVFVQIAHVEHWYTIVVGRIILRSCFENHIALANTVKLFEKINLHYSQKVIKEVKPDSPSTSTSQELPSVEKLSSKAAAAITALNTSKQPKKGGPRTKKAVSLPVKPTRKPAHKGVKATTKSVLKNTILSKRKSKAEENDIEDDLQKIQAIVSSVEGGEAGSSQQGTSEK